MDDLEVRARVPADVEAPDKIVWGLTARQVAILAGAAAAGWLVLKTVGGSLPPPVLMAVLVPFAGVTVVIALGRRDGLPFDAWLLAALRQRRMPRRLVPAPDGLPAGDGQQRLSVLRLPARSVSDAGVIDLGDGSTVLVAATTVNAGLRTAAEQAALVDGYARWLNGLTGPVQVIVSTRRVDLSSHAQRVADTIDALPDPALADAAWDYAEFLLQIAERRDPLWRTVTIACTAHGERGTPVEAMRRAEHTAASLAVLGSQTRVLDGATATAVLTAAVDPYQDTDASWPRARADETVTGTGQWR